MSPAAKTVVATTHFSYADGDKEVHVHAGERFASTHPAVKRYGDWFEPDDTDVKRPTRRSSKP
jgi:hypothetical protein